jgi:hypothetical protein
LFTPYLRTADTFTLRGKWVEIDILLDSDADQNLTPKLTRVELSLTAESESNGITVETLEEWANGTSQNLTFTGTTAVTASITPPLTVGDTYFVSGNRVEEVDADKQPVFAISGENLPQSEVQAFAGIFGAGGAGLDRPRSVVRTSDRRYVVCDTYNHRIFIFDSGGQILDLYAGANEDVDQDASDVFGLTATYNDTTGVLWLGFSKTVTIPAASFSKIVLVIGGKEVNLSEEGQLLAADESMSGRAVGVTLTAEHQSLLSQAPDDAFVYYDAGFVGDFNDLFARRTIRVYFAPVSYHPYIWHPVYAAPSSNGYLWVCNATKLKFETTSSNAQVEPDVPETRNLQEFSPDRDLGRYTNSVYFSTVLGGSVYEDTDGNLLVAGLNNVREGKIYLNPLQGVPQVMYSSPFNNQPTQIDQDSEGYYWVSESSGTDRAGRVLKMDIHGNILGVISGQFTLVNGIQVLPDDRLLVST